MRTVTIAAMLSTSLALAGCASSSDEIAPAYVSPYAYQNYSCAQLNAEMERISMRVHQVAGSVDSASTRDKVATGVGLVLFWPALLMIKGNGPEQEELAWLKGQYDAANEAMIQHNCNAAPAAVAAAPVPQPAGSTVTASTATAPAPVPTYSAYKAWSPNSDQKRSKAEAGNTISGAVH